MKTEPLKYKLVKKQPIQYKPPKGSVCYGCKKSFYKRGSNRFVPFTHVDKGNCVEKEKIYHLGCWNDYGKLQNTSMGYK